MGAHGRKRRMGVNRSDSGIRGPRKHRKMGALRRTWGKGSIGKAGGCGFKGGKEGWRSMERSGI